MLILIILYFWKKDILNVIIEKQEDKLNKISDNLRRILPVDVKIEEADFALIFATWICSPSNFKFKFSLSGFYSISGRLEQEDVEIKI